MIKNKLILAHQRFLTILLLFLLLGLLAPGVQSDNLPSGSAKSFLDALQAHDTAKITQLLRDDPGLAHVTLDKGQTLLEVACESFEPIDLVGALLAAGADVNAKDNDGVTALMKAVGHHDTAVVALLLQKGADVNARDNKGDTPLTTAISTYDPSDEIVLLLLAHGADVNERGAHEFTPLRACVEPHDTQVPGADIKIAPILLKKGGSYGDAFFDAVARNDIPALETQAAAQPGLINKRLTGLTPLDQAVFWQNADAAKWLLAHGAAVNAKNDRGETPIVHTLNEIEDNSGDNGFVSLLLAHHARLDIPDKDGQMPLQIAAFLYGLDKENTDELLGKFLAHGASVNTADPSGTPLLTSLTHSGFMEAAQFLLNHGASYHNAFLDAVAHGRLAAVQTLLTKTPRLAQAVDAGGDSPLAVAVAWGQKPVISALLAHGAKINAKTDNEGDAGYTVLMQAVDANDRDMTAFLLSKGADVNARTANGKTPLGSAIEHANNEPHDARLIRLLLDKGANPRAWHMNKDQNVLGWAIFYDEPNVVTLLLQKGADPNAKINSDETPLRAAIGYEHRAVALILRQHGARDSAGPLIDAVTQGDRAGIQGIVKTNPELVNSRVGPNGDVTPLVDALFWGNPDVVSLLLDLGADPNIGQYPGSSLLVSLAQIQGRDAARQDDKLAALLIAKGANVDVVPSAASGWLTPLSAAVMWHNTPLAALFLKHGAAVDPQDDKGETPLFYAAYHGDKDLATLLLDSGAKVNTQDIFGNTPLEEAIRNAADRSLPAERLAQCKAVIALLREHGAAQ